MNLIKILCCPICKKELSQEGQDLRCLPCKKVYPNKNNVYYLYPAKPFAFNEKSLANKVRSNKALYTLAKLVYSPSLFYPKPYKKLLKNLKKDEVVLDLGSGTRRLHAQAVNFDIHPYPEVDIVGDGYALPFKNNMFSVVIVKTVLEHVSDVTRLMREIAQVTKAQGIIYIEVPFIFNYHASPDDYYRWTMEGLKETCKSLELLETGIVYGPTASLVIILSHYLALLLSFNSSFLYQAMSVLFNAVLKPLTLLDYIFYRSKNAHSIASVLYIIGRKRR